MRNVVHACGLALIGLCGPRVVSAQMPDFNPPHHPEHLLVRFKPGTSEQNAMSAHQGIGATQLHKYRHMDGLVLVKVPADRLQQSCAAYLNNPNVLYAEPDYLIELRSQPNDTYFDDLWGLHNTGQTVNGDPGTTNADIDAPQAWDLWTGDPAGDPIVRIAVLDSGVAYTHPDLDDLTLGVTNIWTNSDDPVGDIPDDCDRVADPTIELADDDCNGYVDDVHGYDVVDDDGDPFPNTGWGGASHGTHVAGIIGAIGNNGVGVVGVNWRCKIVALKFTPQHPPGVPACECALISAACDALDYVIAEEILVSNNSWALNEGYSQTLYDCIKDVRDQVEDGHIFVAAAFGWLTWILIG